MIVTALIIPSAGFIPLLGLVNSLTMPLQQPSDLNQHGPEQAGNIVPEVPISLAALLLSFIINVWSIDIFITWEHRTEGLQTRASVPALSHRRLTVATPGTAIMLQWRSIL